MSRFLTVGTSIVLILGPIAPAQQSEPSLFRYNLANLHTYMLSPAGTTWQAGLTYARSFGGYLASINNAAEQAFINANANYQLVTGGFWIGLSDHASEGTYVWDSGEPFSYSNWAPGEPNNLGNEDFVHAIYTPTNQVWSDNQSPGALSDAVPNQSLIEMAFGDRVNFDFTSIPNGCVSVPTPLGAGNSEGVSWNGSGIVPQNYAFLSNINGGAGMPVSGPNYLLVQANGPVSVPLGGLFPRPAAANANEVRVLIPPGIKGVSFAWEFLTAEALNSPYNDGLSIAVVDVNGNLVLDLAYADVSYIPEPSIPSFGYCFNPPTTVRPVASPGVQTRSQILPPLPTPAYLSIVCWNGGDNAFSSAVAVDAIHFWGGSVFKLDMLAPFGAGSIALINSNGIPGNSYVTAVTTTPGTFPNGWLFGLDIAAPELISQIQSGPPFSGTLSALGHSAFGVPSGVPPGIPIHAVSLQFGATGPFGGAFVNASSPEFFLTF